MPRTQAKGGRRKDPNNDPVKAYEKLARHDKIICWNYYQYITTDGAEGWNPREAGSVFHQRSSEYLVSLGSGSWFQHRAKLMVNLAEKFALINAAPEEPNPPTVNRQAKAGTTAASAG